MHARDSHHRNKAPAQAWPERTMAMVAALLLPALVLALMLRQIPPRTVSRPAALQLVWIERPLPPEPSVPPPRSQSSRPTTAASSRTALGATTTAPREAALQVVDIAASVRDRVAPAAAPSSAQLLRQASRAAVAGGGPDFRQGLLDNRVTAHDGVRDGRFAMRQALSPQDVVNGIGRTLFGAVPDPCPEIRQDITRNSGVGGNRERLEEALRRDRAGHCR